MPRHNSRFRSAVDEGLVEVEVEVEDFRSLELEFSVFSRFLDFIVVIQVQVKVLC